MKHAHGRRWPGVGSSVPHPGLAFAFLACLVLTGAAYAPGLPGFFIYDDFPNLVRHTAFQFPVEGWWDLWRIVNEGLSSTLGRPVSLLSFAFNHMFSGGFDPLALKLTNIGIHALNGALLFMLVRWLVGESGAEVTKEHANRVALICMALWLLHPLNLTSVLYVVQRMNSLAALFVLGGLLGYVQARRMHGQGRRGWVPLGLVLCIAWPAATLAKENGILLVLYALVIEVAIFRWRGDRTCRRELLIFHCIGLLPFLAALGYVLVEPGMITAAYGGRDFGPVERLLTEARVLWLYLGLILIPDPGRMSLYHDDIAISVGWLHPPATLFSVIGLVAFILVALAARRRLPWLFFAVAWFLVGHALESTVIALRLAQEHRNYLPQVGILLPLAVVFAKWSQDSRWRWLPAALCIGMLTVATMTRAYTWGDFGRFVASEYAHHPLSPTAHTNRIKWLVDRADRDPVEAVSMLSSALEVVDALERVDPSPRPLAGLYRVLIHGRLARLGRPVDERVGLDFLVDRLARTRLTPLELNLLGHAVTCSITGRCHLTPLLLDRIVSAALASERNGGRIRAYLHGARADLSFALRRDFDRALEDIALAARYDPQISSYTVRWIELLILTGRLETASRVLGEEGRRLDANLRAALERELTARTRSRRTPR